MGLRRHGREAGGRLVWGLVSRGVFLTFLVLRKVKSGYGPEGSALNPGDLSTIVPRVPPTVRPSPPPREGAPVKPDRRAFGGIQFGWACGLPDRHPSIPPLTIACVSSSCRCLPRGEGGFSVVCTIELVPCQALGTRSRQCLVITASSAEISRKRRPRFPWTRCQCTRAMARRNG
ncbi:hypothetical protein GQ53DRAFT_259266 [Thozetella sp. PMI_491]|nr:hypothetical protein GQ53DRAFT_259266 [Thozetella sp. PMI_491]